MRNIGKWLGDGRAPRPQAWARARSWPDSPLRIFLRLPGASTTIFSGACVFLPSIRLPCARPSISVRGDQALSISGLYRTEHRSPGNRAAPGSTRMALLRRLAHVLPLCQGLPRRLAASAGPADLTLKNRSMRMHQPLRFPGPPPRVPLIGAASGAACATSGPRDSGFPNTVLSGKCKGVPEPGLDSFGGSGEIRTRDQRIKSPLLYRLSYRPPF